MDNKKDNLNFNYKKLLDDKILFDNVLNTNEKDFNKKEIITEMIKGNISDLVKNQLNINKRNDLQEMSYKDNKNYTNENKKDTWFAEYKKQTITVTKEKIRAYLKNYKDLDKLIKYRKKKIMSGKIKPESNELNLGDFEDYDFLEESVIDEQTFYPNC